MKPKRHQTGGSTRLAGVPGVTVLYYELNAFQGEWFYRLHDHDFWQMEVIQGDHWEILTPSGSIRVAGNDCLVFPPGTKHGFRFSGGEARYVSVKFHWAGAMPAPGVTIAPRNAFARKWVQSLWELVDLEGTSSRILMSALGAWVSAMLENISPGCPEAAAGLPSCLQRAVTYVEKNAGRNLTVNETARMAGVAPSYLSAVFRKNRGATLKSYIDEQRMETAKAMLRYADLSIAEVSEKLGFPDIFAFSRFFKRHAGSSPRRYRKL